MCEQKVYRDLLARAIIRHGYIFSWVEHERNREIHTYLNNEVRTITRDTAKANCLKEYTQCTNSPTPILSSTPSSHTGGSSLRIGNRKCKFDYLAIRHHSEINQEFDENDSKYSSGSGKPILDTYLEDPKIERKDLGLGFFEGFDAICEKYVKIVASFTWSDLETQSRCLSLIIVICVNFINA
ncbi:hypothetical protein Cgig2_000039 [Carnegiea gigantea]|uniref:Uncharacterized protein n=1 Tax=Carnegiea gigantea TaxID=171969 RepID=A0A9Q1KYX5_9CARY|nr:hypothetical protein Cgig2_000039 [Carnegiea gigantea]